MKGEAKGKAERVEESTLFILPFARGKKFISASAGRSQCEQSLVLKTINQSQNSYWVALAVITHITHPLCAGQDSFSFSIFNFLYNLLISFIL